MEVKYEINSINSLFLDVYVDEVLWKVVKSSYFIKKMPSLIKSINFKEEFLKLERKKALNVSLYLLSKRGYLKKEWEKKMQEKMFPSIILEEVYIDHLSSYFNEEEEVKRRLMDYYSRGKSLWWAKMKLSGDLYLNRKEFDRFCSEIFSEDRIVEKIRDIERRRLSLKLKGRDKTIAFFLWAFILILVFVVLLLKKNHRKMGVSCGHRLLLSFLAFGHVVLSGVACLCCLFVFAFRTHSCLLYPYIWLFGFSSL